MTLHSRKLVHRQDAFSGKMVSRCGMVEEWRSRKRDLGENSRPSSASMGKGTLVNLGNACSGFVTIDEDTADHRNFQWARVLVKARSRNFPVVPRNGHRVEGRRRLHIGVMLRGVHRQRGAFVQNIEVVTAAKANNDSRDPHAEGDPFFIDSKPSAFRAHFEDPSQHFFSQARCVSTLFPRLCSGASSSPSSGGDVFATVGDFCLAQRGGLVKSILHVEEKPLKMIMKDGRAFDLLIVQEIVDVPSIGHSFQFVFGDASKRFKKEILALLRKMEDRQRKKAPISGKGAKGWGDFWVGALEASRAAGGVLFWDKSVGPFGNEGDGKTLTLFRRNSGLLGDSKRTHGVLEGISMLSNSHKKEEIALAFRPT
ncbi:hypothetical protein CK203_097235 [Vitis vinifera]|uniref:Uncharacterized protein n=1 Tax=Vitis vinifera TaxID=29760 RepID=A0A438DIY9_VITVI|nr:hypothetical protein CK203_097235 [Vitis vinifera]